MHASRHVCSETARLRFSDCKIYGVECSPTHLYARFVELQNLNTTNQEVATLEKNVAELERDVEQLDMEAELQNKITEINAKKSWLEYWNAKVAHEARKQELHVCQRELADAKERANLDLKPVQ